MEITSPIDEIKGIGEKTKNSFAKLGVYTIRDILLHFPKNYVKFPKIQDLDEIDLLVSGKFYAIHAVIRNNVVVKATSRMPITLLTIKSNTKTLSVVWYRMPYIKNELVPGKHIILYGKISEKNNKYMMEQPVIYDIAKYQTQIEETLQPVYGLTSGITNNLIIKTIKIYCFCHNIGTICSFNISIKFTFKCIIYIHYIFKSSYKLLFYFFCIKSIDMYLSVYNC